jgi:acylphosphatase
MTSADDVSLHAVVRGRVQGVGYRDFVERRAQSMSLTGYVRNLPDGRSVEVAAEGSRDALERLIEKLSDGPGMSVVQSVETHWGPATGQYRGFEVRF